MTVWLNGEFYEKSDGLISLTDRGLMLADGIFETILVKDKGPVFFKQHMARLRAGAAALAIPLHHTDADIHTNLKKLVHKQKIMGEDVAVRLTLTRGIGARGIALPTWQETHPTLFMTASAVLKPSTNPVSLIVSSIRRNEGSPVSSLKTLAYTDNILARREADLAGADDAILLNNGGHICCTTITNIFIVKNDTELLTPDLRSGALPGIVRQIVMKIATDIDLSVQETEIPPSVLNDGEIFLTNSLQGLRAAFLKSGDGCNRNLVSPGKVLLELQRQYAQKIDEDRADRKIV